MGLRSLRRHWQQRPLQVTTRESQQGRLVRLLMSSSPTFILTITNPASLLTNLLSLITTTSVNYILQSFIIPHR